MVSHNVNRVLEAARALSEAEQAELRRLLQDRVARPAPADAQLEEILRQRGVSRSVPPQRTPQTLARLTQWKPITMPGGALADDLIRDRR